MSGRRRSRGGALTIHLGRPMPKYVCASEKITQPSLEMPPSIERPPRKPREPVSAIAEELKPISSPSPYRPSSRQTSKIPAKAEILPRRPPQAVISGRGSIEASVCSFLPSLAAAARSDACPGMALAGVTYQEVTRRRRRERRNNRRRRPGDDKRAFCV